MNYFSDENKNKVLDALFQIASEPKSTNVSAIKLYLELAEEQVSPEELTTEKALEILRVATQQSESSS